MPICHTGAWNDSYLPSLWISTAMLLTSFIFPLPSQSPKVISSPSAAVTTGLQPTAQAPKEGHTEPSVALQVLQPSPRRKLQCHSVDRRPRIRSTWICWTTTLFWTTTFRFPLSTTVTVQSKRSIYFLGMKASLLTLGYRFNPAKKINTSLRKHIPA